MDNIFNYGLLTVSTIMFGLMFFFNDVFRKHYGHGLQATMVMNFGSNLFGVIAIIIIKVAPVGFAAVISEIKSGFTPFVVIMSLWSAVNGILFSYCSLKALDKISLSLYSLFSMLGGMTLPFVAGILFGGESFTIGKAICFIIIAIALFITVDKGAKNSGLIYYIGIFVFNGMAGVIANIYQTVPCTKMDSAGYSIFKALTSLLLAAIILLIIKKEKRKINIPCIVGMAGSGALGHIANWLLLIPLSTTVITFAGMNLGGLDSSAQYSFITGGTMITSTIISLFTAKKPTIREIIAVLLAFIGIIFLIAVPEYNIFTINW